MASIKDRLRAAVTPGLTIEDIDPNANTPFKDIGEQILNDFGAMSNRQRSSQLEMFAQQRALDEAFNEQFYASLQPDDPVDDTLRAQYKAVELGLNSKYAAVRERAEAERVKLFEAARANAIKNEEQSIADRTAREASGVAGEALRYERDMNLSEGLRKDVVNPYQEQMQMFNKANQLLDTGDRMAYEMAFTMAIQSLDGSVVRSEERMSYAGANGLAAAAVDRFNAWMGNKTPETEAALRRAVSAMGRASTDTYRETIDTYRRQTEAYGGDWKRVGSVVPELQDWDSPGRISTDRVPEADAEDAPNPLRDNPLEVAAAGASAVLDEVPDSVKTGVAAAAGLSAPALLSRALPVAGPASVLAAAYAMPVDAELEKDGTVRGVYVPRWLRSRLRRSPRQQQRPTN